MRVMLFLFIVVIGAVAAWWWMRKPAAPTAPDASASPFAPAPIPAPTSFDRAGSGKTPPVAGGQVLPAEAKAALDQADAQWNQLAAQGGKPEQGKGAPQLARLYSKALRALYNQGDLKAVEDRLVSDRLTPLGSALFFSRQPFPDDSTGLIGVHAVVAGDSPDKISKQHAMARELVNRLRKGNDSDPNDARMQIGETVKVIKAKDLGGYLVRIDKGDYTLDCWVGGVFARRYTISHGAVETPTPTGSSKVIDRVWHPQWTNPKSHEVLPFGHADNILGPIWLPFAPDGIGKTGIGIHGFTGPEPRLGAQVSNGCIRMGNKEAEELFFTLPHPDRCPIAVEIVD